MQKRKELIKITDCSVYTKTGELHKENNIENQDVTCRFENSSIEFYAVADGVSSCKNSRQGAELACCYAEKICREEYRFLFGCSADIIGWLIVQYIQKHIRKYAEERNEAPESYASTLSFVCIDKKTGKTMAFNLGDSRIYLLKPDGISLCGCTARYGGNLICATMTKNAYMEAGINFFEEDDFSGLLLCTDGAWKELINNEQIKDYMEPKVLSDYLDRCRTADDCTFLHFKKSEG